MNCESSIVSFRDSTVVSCELKIVNKGLLFIVLIPKSKLQRFDCTLYENQKWITSDRVQNQVLLNSCNISYMLEVDHRQRDVLSVHHIVRN